LKTCLSHVIRVNAFRSATSRKGTPRHGI